MYEFTFSKARAFCRSVLFGTAGIKILSSKDAKKVYTEATAAALRAKDCVMTTVTTVKENADDILADAKEINEKRAAEDEKIVEDASGKRSSCRNSRSRRIKYVVIKALLRPEMGLS